MFRYLIRTNNKEEIESLRLMYKDKERVSASPTCRRRFSPNSPDGSSTTTGFWNPVISYSKQRKRIGPFRTPTYQHARFFEATYNLRGKEHPHNALGFLGQMTELDKAISLCRSTPTGGLGNIS